MIRVLHIYNVMNRGGAETMIMNVYRNIDREKIQFDFLCMSDKTGDYDNEILELGGRIFRISPPAESGYIRHIKDIIKILKEKGPYKVIHAPTMFHSGILCLVGYISGVPIRIAHSHSSGINDNDLIRKIYNMICRQLIRIFATDKIACGINARDFLFGKSKKTEKEVLILNNGIDLDQYYNVKKEEIMELKKELKIQDEFIIGNVGRFAQVKNQDFFISLAENFRKKNDNFKIILVGDGELRETIEKKIKEKQLGKYFILTGKRDDIYKIMNLMDIFVMPSLYEGFPMVIIEALASGKNCVVSDKIPREIEIVNGSISFMSLEDNIQSWINEIEIKAKQHVNKEERKNILKEKGFSILDTTKILEKIYLR